MSSYLLRGQFVRMLAIAAFVLLGAAAGRAEDARPRRTRAAPAATPAPDTVLATIDGQPITEADLELALSDLDQQFARLPAEQRRAAAMSAIIEIRLLAEKAVAAGIDKQPDFQRQIEFLRQRSLHSQLVAAEVAGQDHRRRRSAPATIRRWPTRRRSTKCMRVTSS